MKKEIQISYSEDCFTVEAENVKRLFDLQIVRVSVRGRRIALTPRDANKLGCALLEASTAGKTPETPGQVAPKAIEHTEYLRP